MSPGFRAAFAGRLGDRADPISTGMSQNCAALAVQRATDRSGPDPSQTGTDRERDVWSRRPEREAGGGGPALHAHRGSGGRQLLQERPGSSRAPSFCAPCERSHRRVAGPDLALEAHSMMTTDEQLDDSLVRDEALVDRARRGSGAAFAALVARHGDAVYAIARNMCATLRDAEEVLQQAFLSAWRDLKLLPAGARFTTWLYGIAMKTALEHRQNERRRQSE